MMRSKIKLKELKKFNMKIYENSGGGGFDFFTSSFRRSA